MKRKRILFCFVLLTGILIIYGVLKSSRNTSDVVLEIHSVEDWQAFARSVNEGNIYHRQKVKLCADLDFTGVEEHVMVGEARASYYGFSGFFDGDGHTISNVTIISDSVAGLFVDLTGSVSNLTVVNETLSAPDYCGAIAATASEAGSVVNCRVEADIDGYSYCGFIGNTVGNVRNCWGFEEKPSAEELNQGIRGISGSFDVERWHRWEESENGPVLTKNVEDAVDYMTTKASIDGRQLTVSAYYSIQEGAWCFTFPSGCIQKTLEIDIRFLDGWNLHMTAEPGELTAFERNGIIYPIKSLYTVNCPSFVITTGAEDSLDYLYDSKENRLTGKFSFYSIGGEAEKTGTLYSIASHGNHSWYAAKKGFNLEFPEETELDHMGKSLKYVLLPGYRDNSLITYKLTADLAQRTGMDFAPETRLVHLYFDSEYLGMYFLTPRIEIGEDRFAITDSKMATEQINKKDLRNYEQIRWSDPSSSAYRTWFDIPHSPEDVSGGYILEMDSWAYDDYKSRFVSKNGISVVLRSNPYASKRQVNYIADFWQDFEDALYSEDGKNDKGKHYTEYIDLTSFADQWIFYELNMETSVSASVYFYKDSDLAGDGLLHAVYPWDNEHGFTALDKYVTRSWFAAETAEISYWPELMKHQDFRKMVYEEWKNKFLPELENALEPSDGLLTRYLRSYGEDGVINSSRWYQCRFEERLEEIRGILDRRKDFLTKVFARYEGDEYSYYREKEGIFYGVTEQGEYVELDPMP